MATAGNKEIQVKEAPAIFKGLAAMNRYPSSAAFAAIAHGHNVDPAKSLSLVADAYVEPEWHRTDMAAIIGKTWQWVCHAEALRTSGAYVATTVAGQPIAVVRDDVGELRAFYNVCKHRAHELLNGRGTTRRIMCPYHAWVYRLNGQLVRAPAAEHLKNFRPGEICLDPVQVEEFAGFVFVCLDPDAPPLHQQSGELENEVRYWAPDIEDLTFAHRLEYDIKANWKTVVDNFLECYHCPTAHKDFCQLVDMDTYKVTTHGIYSSHMADAGRNANSAYDTSNATVRTHAVWWLWPTTCLMRYPGRSSMIVLNIIPAGPERTLETYDFFLPTSEPNETEQEAIRYLDEVLQVEDIRLVESVQRGMRTPAFSQGRIVHDPSGSGQSEHAVHHFHGLVLDAYRHAGPSLQHCQT